VSAIGPYCRVLVGFDGSPDAAEALRFGVAMCDGGELVVLCVIQRVLPPGADGEGRDGAGLRTRAQSLLGELAREALPGSPVRASVQVAYSGGDSPGNVVTSYAGERGFDLLVLGRHGAGGRHKSMLGRVAERAARACPVPVLLLSAPGPDARIRVLRGDASSGMCLGPGQTMR